MKIHSKIKPFECSICGGKYSRSSTLKIHSYTHLEEKPFKCPYQGCNRGFTEKGNMQVHLKTHFKESKSNTLCETTSTQVLLNDNSNATDIKDAVENNISVKNSNVTNGIWNNNCNINTNVIDVYKCIYPFPYQVQSTSYPNSYYNQQHDINSYYNNRSYTMNNNYIMMSPQHKPPQQSYLQYLMMCRYGFI